MKIALVDDDPRALAQLEQYLTEQLGRETEISHYGSGEALLADWRPGAFELVVLDIYMGGATGMEVARRLRAGDGQVRLAFATSSNDFASESYEVGACYYLRKPFRPEGVRAMLERLDLEALERSRRLRLPDGSQVVLRSIRYAASDGHRVTLHCKDGDRTLRTSFAAVEPLLCAYPCFCGICRGVVVNFHEAVAAALVAVLTLLQMGLGLCAAFFTPGRGSLLSAVSTGLYAVFYFLAVRAYPGKTLFTLLMISNLANLVVIAAKCLEGQLFPALAVQSYRWSFALMMLAVEAVLFLPLLLYVRKVYTPAVEQETSGLAWRYLWLIPATFYLIWYYVIYGNTNLTGLEIALRPSSTIVLLFINTGAALVYYVVARLVLEQEKLVALQQKNYALAMQSLQYENLQERIAEARQAKHDVRHHIALLQDCLRRKDYDAMQAYLDRYQETLPDARQLQFCGNAAVNAVLSYFAQQAAAQQVEFSVKAQLPEYTGVADPDLTVLFGNLLENALTACMQEASPRIVVRITADAHTLCAAVDNTFTGAVRRTTGGFLSTKHAGLGLGTASVRSIAEKYHGVCRLEPRDGMFCASVLLELPQEKL